MRPIFALGVILMAWAAAPTAGLQEEDLSRVREAFTAAQADRIAREIAAAERDGVPRALLIEQADLGIARGLVFEVVFRGLRTRAEELRRAVQVLGRGADAEGLEKSAEVLRHGVAPDLVRGLARDHPDDYPILFQAIEDLLHAGVAVDVAQDMIREASDRGLKSQDVLTLSARVRRLVREGSSPADAVGVVRRTLRSGSVVPPPPPIG